MRTVKSLSVLSARGERFCELLFEASLRVYPTTAGLRSLQKPETRVFF